MLPKIAMAPKYRTIATSGSSTSAMNRTNNPARVPIRTLATNTLHHAQKYDSGAVSLLQFGHVMAVSQEGAARYTLPT